MKTTLFAVVVKGLSHPLQMRATSLADAKVSARLLFGRDAKVVTV